MDISISIPSNYDVFMRNMSKSNSLFSKYGLSYSELMNYFKSQNIYLNAVGDNGNVEIVVTMVDNVMGDFVSYGDTMTNAIASVLMKEYRDYGMDVTSYDIYHHPQLLFIRAHFNDDKKTVYGLQYYTVSNNRAMSFTIRSYDGKITASQENVIQSVVDSVCLNSYAQTSIEEITPAFSYIDSDTGLTFTMPENWKKGELSEKREFLDVKFVSTIDPVVTIIYGSTDLWSQIPIVDKPVIRRADFDNTIFNEEIIREALGSPATVKKITVNGKEYYQAEVATTIEMLGMSLPFVITSIIRAENGWVYWFQFLGDSNSSIFQDFYSVLSSVVYPATEPNSYVHFLMCIIIGAVVVVMVYNIIRKMSKKLNAEKLLADRESGFIIENVNGEFIYCHMCGAKNLKDSCFCSSCGTRIAIDEQAYNEDE